MLTADQLALRKSGIGASEVAAVMGISRRTPLQVYGSKLGEADNLDHVEAVQWGNTLEPVIALKYAERMTLELRGTLIVRESPTLVGEKPWELATPDRLIEHEMDGPVEHWGLEIKVRTRSSPEWGPDGSSQVPPEVYYQCLWGMVVTGLRRWDVAALFGGTEMRVYTLQYDPDLARLARELVSDFWNSNVLLGVPPLAVGLDSEKMAKYLPAKTTDMTRLDDENALNLTASYLYVLRERIKELEAEKDDAEATLKQAIGEDLGLVGKGWQAKWAPAKGRSSVNVDALIHDYGISPEKVAQYTMTGAPSRRFNFTYYPDAA